MRAVNMQKNAVLTAWFLPFETEIIGTHNVRNLINEAEAKWKAEDIPVIHGKAELELHDRGFDFRFGYNGGYNSPCDFYDDEDEIIKGQCEKFCQKLDIDKTTYIPTVSCFQDPSPRFSERWNKLGYRFRAWSNIWYLSPEKFRELIRKIKGITDKLPENAWARRIIMIVVQMDSVKHVRSLIEKMKMTIDDIKDWAKVLFVVLGFIIAFVGWLP